MTPIKAGRGVAFTVERKKKVKPAGEELRRIGTTSLCEEQPVPRGIAKQRIKDRMAQFKGSSNTRRHAAPELNQSVCLPE